MLEVEKKALGEEQTRTTKVAVPQTSGSFLEDILGYAGSESMLERLQMVVWTGVLAVTFVVESTRTYSMPEFSAELLSLTGISSGAYVLLKAVGDAKPKKEAS